MTEATLFERILVGEIPAFFLTLDGAGGKLWPVFGASNQMLAALTLMVLSIYFWQKKKNILPLVLPMGIIIIIALSSLVLNAIEFSNSGNMLLLSIDVTLILLTLWMIAEGFMHIRKLSNE